MLHRLRKSMKDGTNTGKLIIDSIYGGIPPYSVQWGGINTDSLNVEHILYLLSTHLDVFLLKTF